MITLELTIEEAECLQKMMMQTIFAATLDEVELLDSIAEKLESGLPFDEEE